MGFGEAIRSGFSKYVTFSGRARRSEVWWFYLFSFLVIMPGAVIDEVAGTAPLLYALTTLGLFLPNLAVSIRRLHDLNMSGWSYLLVLIPLVGSIILIVFYCKDGTHGSNNYGPDPKGQADQIGYNPDAVFS